MAIRILVVDDEPQVERLLRQRFRQQLKSREYDLVFASSGKEALNILEKEPDIPIVLSDINMPEMDGLTFVSKLRQNWPHVKVVMVSAYGDMANIRAAMNLGAFDFVTKPINFEDLNITLRKTLREVEVSKRAERARELELNNEKLRELDQVKSTFFTNISHEFRTPLTVIRGMADQIREKPDRWLAEGLHMIKRNSDNLLQLVNQILDLAKLESGKLKLRLKQADIISYLRYLTESFRTLAEQHELELTFLASEEKLYMDHDPERLQWILSNLLSNALKFTPKGGAIRVSVSLRPSTDGPSVTRSVPGNNHLWLEVEDTGIGIPKDRLPHLFERFFQVEGNQTSPQQSGWAGTGIGLALTRELVQLMEGVIWAVSEEGKGTTFCVVLPIRQEAELKDQNLRQMEAEEQGAESRSLESIPAEEESVTILLVEDNPDVRTYVRSCLEDNYLVWEARNGQEGIEMAIEQVPDLIVSDVMMPEKDGFELCEALKGDIRTSHIPIVLLTAKADQESRISGLRYGADAYLAKPFNREELEVRLEQLLENRRKLQERFRRAETGEGSKGEAISQEDAFLTRVREQLEKNLDDENLGISGLARAIGVSRAQLHNKIKALTGQSPSVFVRTIRLRKARQLLLTTDLNVTQIAYEVGFRDPAYFSRTFSEEYGHSPKETRTEDSG